MSIEDLIRHYKEMKSLHSPLPPSLAEKLPHLTRVFGKMAANSDGASLVKAANSEWGSCSPGTVKRYLVQIKAILRRAERDGLIDKAPMIDLPYVNDTVYIDITAKEVNLLLDYIKWTERGWYPLALVLTHTGARLGEALSMTESNFTRLGVRIDSQVGRKSKTIHRVIPYTARLKREITQGAVFVNGVQLRPKDIAVRSVPTCLGRVIDSSVKALGLPSMRVHDMRHAFASVLAENGADMADLVTALGHSSPSMSLRYRGLVRGRLNDIMSRI